MQAPLDITLLRNFVAVTRMGSISAAALRAGRTQSAVSMQMQRLEETVGQPLLHRTGAGVRPTSAGDRLLVHAERILSAHDEAMAELSGEGLVGAIRFGCPEDYLAAFMPALLRGFSSQHPCVEIEVVCAPTVELQPLLQSRRVDAALISLPDAAAGEDVLRPEPFVWIADSARPAILESRVVPLALPAPNTLEHRAACAAMDRAGRAYRIAFASNGLAGLLAFARSGQAVSVVTQAAAPPDLHALGAKLLPPMPDIGIALRYAPGRQSVAARSFGDFIRTALKRKQSGGGRRAG